MSDSHRPRAQALAVNVHPLQRLNKRDGWRRFARLAGSASSHRRSRTLFVKLSQTANSSTAQIQRQPWCVQTFHPRATRNTILGPVELCQTLREPPTARSIRRADSSTILNYQRSPGTAERVKRGRTTELSDRRWQRAPRMSDDVHEPRDVKTEALSGGSSPAILLGFSWIKITANAGGRTMRNEWHCRGRKANRLDP